MKSTLRVGKLILEVQGMERWSHTPQPGEMNQLPVRMGNDVAFTFSL